MLYLIETECGGPDAAGHGCGAPLNLKVVDEATFNSVTGRVQNHLFNHTIEEAESYGIHLRAPAKTVENLWDDYDDPQDTCIDHMVKLIHRPCNYCRVL